MASAASDFVVAISQAADQEACWQALETLAKAAAGHVLFTVTMADARAGIVRRAYSNRPNEYPTSGSKPLGGNTGNWFETVFGKRQTFVANTLQDIAKVFPDHELIGSMGLGSVVNFPVVLEDELVATINLLDAPGHYTAERVAAVEALLPVPARLCAALTLYFGAKPIGLS